MAKRNDAQHDAATDEQAQAEQAHEDEQARREAVNEAQQAVREAETAALKAEASGPEEDAEPEPGRPQPSAAGTPEGVSAADVAWWNNSQNRNYMAGDGPQAGITEVDGDAQSASSVDPEIRAATLAESQEARDKAHAERIAEADRNAQERRAAQE